MLAFSADAINILPQGSFEKGTAGVPEGFAAGGFLGAGKRNKADWVKNNEGKFIRVEASRTEKERMVTWLTKPDLPVNPAWQTVTVKFKVRTDKKFKVGTESWHDARVIVTWLGTAIEGENVLRQDPIVATTVPLLEWKEVSETLQPPKGAITMRLELGTWGGSGTIDFDDVEVIAK